MAVEKKTDRPLEPAEIAKLEAEAKAFLARAAKESADARRLNAEAVACEADALVAVNQAARDAEKRARELHAFDRQQVYLFSGQVDEGSHSKCVQELNHWHHEDPTAKWEIVFNSPGGSVFAGMALYDYIQEMRRAGHYITTSTRGMAASMGGILLQAGDWRVMGAESFVLIHEISTFTGGKIGEIEDTMALLKRMEERVLTIFSSRSKLSKAKLQANWRRKDWWIDSTDCLRFGLVDEVR